MIKHTLFAFITIIEWFHCSHWSKGLLLFIADTKSLLLQTRHFLLYLSIFISSTLLCVRQALLLSLNLTSLLNLGNISSTLGSKLLSMDLSFITVNQQSANLNNLFVFFFFFNCTSFLANNGGLFSSLQDWKQCLLYDLIFKTAASFAGGSPNDLDHHAAWELINQDWVWQEGKKLSCNQIYYQRSPHLYRSISQTVKSSTYTCSLLLGIIAG